MAKKDYQFFNQETMEKSIKSMNNYEIDLRADQQLSGEQKVEDGGLWQFVQKLSENLDAFEILGA